MLRTISQSFATRDAPLRPLGSPQIQQHAAGGNNNFAALGPASHYELISAHYILPNLGIWTPSLNDIYGVQYLTHVSHSLFL